MTGTQHGTHDSSTDDEDAEVAPLPSPPKLYGEGDLLLVDFDKTLTLGEESYFTEGEEQPDREMIEWVNQQYRNGAHIIIWTARPWSVAGETAGLATKWGLRFHGLRCEKGAGTAYIDDKALRPEEVR